MTVQRATKKPVTIDFVEWTGRNLVEVQSFIEGKPVFSSCRQWGDYEDIVRDKGLVIKTLEGRHVASVGDMIIKGVKAEFYPCKPDIFEATYEAVRQ